MSEHTLKLIEAIRHRIESTRRRLTLFDVSAGFLLTVAAVLTIWFVAVMLEAGLWLPSSLRYSFLAALLVVATVLTGRFVFIPLARYMGWFDRFTEYHVARLVGRTYPEVDDRMINLLQLAHGSHSSATDEMLDRAVNELGREIEPVPFERVATTSRLKRIAAVALVPVLALIIFMGASPSAYFGASERILSPGHAFSRPAPFTITVVPGNAEIVRGDSVDVVATISRDGIDPPLTIEYAYDGEVRTRAEAVQQRPDGKYAYRFVGVRHALRYRVVSPPVETEWFDLNVVERPIVQRLNVTLRAPAYTRLPVQVLEANVGDITAVRGTRADLSIRVSGSEVAEARLVYSDGSSSGLSVEGDNVTGALTVTRPIRYRIELMSSNGIVNAAPITYEISVIDDAVPTATFLYPDPHTNLSDEAVVPFAVQFSDDFGFSSLTLHYRLTETRFDIPDDDFSTMQLPLENPGLLDQIHERVWSLREDTGLDPVPGDVFEYYVEVKDNDRYGGFKSAVTATHTVRFPSLAEQYEELDRNEDATESAMEDLLEEAREVRDQFQTLKEDLRQKPESDWQDERRLEQLQQSQQEIESSVEKISDSIQEMSEQMRQNDLVSDETLDMFQELREVVDEVNSPELMDALKNLEESLENMDLNRMQESLEDFEFNEEMYMERLDRALELFKDLRMQQDLEETRRRMQDLAEREDRLQEETARLENEREQAGDEDAADAVPPDDGRTPPENARENLQQESDQVAAQQEDAAREMEAIEQKMEEILERMQEMKSAPVDQMQDIEEDTKDREIPERMNQAAEELRQQDFQQAGQDQSQIQEQLNQIQGKLGDMQQNMQGQQLQMNMSGIRAALEDVLTLSERQEALRLDVATIRSESPRLRTAAQQQVALSEGLATVSDSLQRLARDIPQMSRNVQQESGEALREMESAVDALTDRSARNASGHQKGAMTHLNELALILSQLMDQMMNSQASSGSGMSMEQLMEQMQNMGQQQQQLNDQIQQLLNDAQGNRLTNDMIERMRQMGAQQEQIRRDLRQINRDRSARNQLLGDLDRLAEQMEESARELLENRMSREFVSRQRQILTRLLEASRSLQERGEERRRESRTGSLYERDGPAELSPAEQVERFRRELFRALESGYAPDYEQLIRRYFEMLQQQSEQTEND